MKSPKQLGELITGVVLYWYLCLLGMRNARSQLVGEESSWGKLVGFKLGMELVCLGHEAVPKPSQRLLSLVADKLCYLAPIRPLYKRRYIRYRLVP